MLIDKQFCRLKEEQNITLKAGVGGRELGGGGTAVGTGEADIAGGRPQAQVSRASKERVNAEWIPSFLVDALRPKWNFL